MKRRNIAKLATGALLLPSIMLLTGKTEAQQAPLVSSAKQTEYLFWLPERDRMIAREVAIFLVLNLDATPLDAVRLSGIYQRSAPALRKRYMESAFVNRIKKYRDGVGKPLDRVLQGVEGGFKFLPNFPDGQYAIVTYDTIFSATSLIYTEQITLSRDSSQHEQWQLLDYYVATKAFYTY